MARHAYPLIPRWSDLDAFGHVNNVAWLEYMQEARVDMIFVHAPAHGAERLAQGVMVVRAHIDYRRPMTFRPEPYSIELWVSELRAATFTVNYAILDSPEPGAVLYGTALTVIAPVNPESGSPRRLAAAERQVLTAFLDDD